MRQNFGLISLGMLNERIRALRLAKGLTLQQVGDVFGISRASVSAWESGVAKPDAAKLVRLAELLETSLSNLLEDSQTTISGKATKTQTITVPFIRWDLIAKNPNAHNPSQLVKVSFSKPTKGVFATRLVAPPDWSWQPGPIPAGAILIVCPAKSAREGRIVLITAPDHPLQLATIQPDTSMLASVNYLENGKKTLFRPSEIQILGEVIEWQMVSNQA